MQHLNARITTLKPRCTVRSCVFYTVTILSSNICNVELTLHLQLPCILLMCLCFDHLCLCHWRALDCFTMWM